MAGRRELRKLVTIWPDVNALLDEWRAFIHRLDSWSWGREFKVDDGDHGRVVSLSFPPSAVSAVAASGGISAMPDEDTLGEGEAVLRLRRGAALTDGPTVKVYSHFSVEVPGGTKIEVAPDGADYKLIAVDYCPDEAEEEP